VKERERERRKERWRGCCLLNEGEIGKEQKTVK